MNNEGMFFRLLGVKRESSGNNMQLPMAEKVQNHIGGMHANAQFALA
jgi:hypothetical protein